VSALAVAQRDATCAGGSAISGLSCVQSIAWQKFCITPHSEIRIGTEVITGPNATEQF